MSNAISDIPVRSNADTTPVDASWWNSIRTALLNVFGNGAVTETQFTIANSTTAYTNVTNLSFDHSTARAIDVHYTIYRDDGTVSRRETGIIHAMYKAREGTWYYERESWGDDALGNGTVSSPLIVSSAGQVQYKADTFAAGTMRYKSVISFNKES